MLLLVVIPIKENDSFLLQYNLKISSHECFYMKIKLYNKTLK